MEENSQKVCESCLKSFPIDAFLRHVSHKQECKNHYKDQMYALKAEGLEIAKAKKRANRYKSHPGHRGMPSVVCEYCKKTFLANTHLKHLVKSKACKAHYGSKFEDLKKRAAAIKASADRKDNLKRYHNLSKDQKAAIVARQKVKRRTMPKEEERKQWKEEMELRDKKMIQESNLEFSRKAKHLNRSERNAITMTIKRWYRIVKTGDQLKALENLTEMAMATYNKLDEEINQTILEAKERNDTGFAKDKYNIFLAMIFTSQIHKPSQNRIQKEWKKIDNEIRATTYKLFKAYFKD